MWVLQERFVWIGHTASPSYGSAHCVFGRIGRIFFVVIIEAYGIDGKQNSSFASLAIVQMS